MVDRFLYDIGLRHEMVKLSDSLDLEKEVCISIKTGMTSGKFLKFWKYMQILYYGGPSNVSLSVVLLKLFLY